MNLFRLLRSLLPNELKIPRTPAQKILAAIGYFHFRTRLANRGASIPDIDLYRPLFSPWEGQADFKRYYDQVRPHTMVSPERCWILLQVMRQALALQGHFAEFGVFRGGTALLTAEVLRDAHDNRPLHLFDSFAGMPATSTGEFFAKGDFGQTSEAAVRSLVAPTGVNVTIHAGYMPGTFQNTGISQLAYAHVDVDLYQSVLDCIEFVHPRLVAGGIMVFDDYGFPATSRAREAVDKAFSLLPENPIYLPTGQAMVIKLP
ncbi:MAG TPA: TylF/MycF/NovP-related O-methyltransferase [Opitutaceae bacterium]|jgi:O-methyltransferase|nr:TylF/MycF/NovP-related O-methyltransferase [Opitutaceae bacterium]